MCDFVNNENNENISMFDVILKFPFATFKTYRLPYSCASNSEFIKNIISCDYEDDELSNLKEPQMLDIEIPLCFYRNLLEKDLDWLFAMWSGKETVYTTDRMLMNHVGVTKLIRALLIDQHLLFVDVLERENPIDF